VPSLGASVEMATAKPSSPVASDTRPHNGEQKSDSPNTDSPNGSTTVSKQVFKRFFPFLDAIYDKPHYLWQNGQQKVLFTYVYIQ
jgi:hypothetical protein